MPPVFIVAQVEAAPAHIQWRVIAAVAGYAAQTRVFINAVTAAGVANQTETIPLPR
jgi:glycerol kinase